MSARGIGGAGDFGPGASRALFALGHVQVRVTAHSDYGVTFGLRTATGPEGRPDLFSGHVSADMAGELRRMADYLDSLAHRIGGGRG